MLRPFTPPGNTCNLANSKGFSYSIAFFSHRFDAAAAKKGNNDCIRFEGIGGIFEG